MMKTLILAVLSCCFSIAVLAQTNPGTVTIVLKGNQNRQVLVDGKDLSPAGISSLTDPTVTLTDLQAGRHQLRVTRHLNGRNRNVSAAFNLRSDYDKKIVVSANGSLQQTESRKVFGAGSKPAMSDLSFRYFLLSLRTDAVTERRTRLREAFANTDYYFTTEQARQLLQLIRYEGWRLELAKTAYRSVTDPWNFDRIVLLLNNQSNREELRTYINGYHGNDETYPPSRSPMTSANFNGVYRYIRNQRSQSAKMAIATNAFTTQGNYFTTNQARQLILLVAGENNRLKLAKLSYERITDPSNFNGIYQVLNRQSDRVELSDYVNGMGHGGTAMSDASFNILYREISREYNMRRRVEGISKIFSNSGNYYSTEQARKLILQARDESDRLQLAKQSYRGISDPANFTLIYSVLNSQADRNQLAAYVSAYYGGTNQVPQTPMTDASYNSLYRSVEYTFGIGAKMESLTQIFANPGYYFTTAQAEKLIRLVSLESNRLQLAKAAYSHITDPGNFSQLYDMLASRSSRNELEAFVRNYNNNR